jgi:O-antigen/teichoic acid export membrane protein
MRGTSGQMLFSALAQLVRYGAPILFYPLLIRELSTQEFAAFVLCMAVGQTIGQFTEFGFGLSAVRELVDHKKDPAAAARASGEVVFGKGLMFATSCVVFLAISAGFATGMHVGEDALIAILIGAAYGFTPNWFYIGVGRAHTLAMCEIVVSFVQLLLVVLIINKGSGHLDAVWTMIIPVIVFAVLGQIDAIRTLALRVPTVQAMRAAIHSAFHFFVATNASALTNRVLLMVLGLVSPATQIAFYAAGERLVSAALNTLTPIMRVLLPRVTALRNDSPEGAHRLATRVLVFGGGLYLAGSLFLAATVEWWIVPVFGPKLAGAGLVVGAFLLVIPVSAFSRITGLLFLVPARRERAFQRITLASCALGLAVAYPTVATFGALGAVALRLAIEAGIAGSIFLVKQRLGRVVEEKVPA